MQQAIESTKKDNSNIIVRIERPVETSNRISRLFREFNKDDIAILFAKVNKYTSKCSLHEIIPADCPVKMYFDIEYTNADLFDLPVIKSLYKSLALFMKVDLLEILIMEWTVLSAHRDGKKSYHLINNSVHFENVWELADFVTKFVASDSYSANRLLWENDTTPIIDRAVYAANKSLRMYRFGKIDNNNCLVHHLDIDSDFKNQSYIGGGFRPTHTLITAAITINSRYIRDIVDMPLSTNKPRHALPQAKYILNNSEIDNTDLEELLSLNNITGVMIINVNNNFVECRNAGHRDCPFDEEGHSKNNCYLTIEGDKVQFNCLAPNCKGQKKEMTLTDKVKGFLNKAKDAFLANMPTGANGKSPEDTYFASGQLEADIAEYVIKVDGDKFIYFDGRLYYFNGVYWQQNNKYEMLTYHLQSKVYKDLNKAIFDKYTDISQSDDKAKAFKNLSMLRLKNKLQNIAQLIIDNPAIIRYTDPFDQQPELIGFKNGVFDLSLGEFREGLPQDYISITTDYEYSTAKEEDIAFVNEYLAKVFPIEEERDFMLKYLSTALSGHNIRNFGILTAIGSNSKSALIEFLHAALGSYGYKGNVCMLNRGLDQGPNPAIANCHKKRLVYFNEADSKYTLSASTLKELCGTAVLNARQNYSNNCSVYNQATYLMMTNDIPAIDKIDQACIDRLVICPFRSLFKSKDRFDDYKNEQYLYEADPYYISIDFQKKYRLALIDILSKYYRHFIKDNHLITDIPLAFKQSASKYAIDCDDFYSWFLDNYERADNAEDYIQLKDVYTSYHNSDLFNNLTKAEKRKQTYKLFIEIINRYPDLRNSYIEVKQYRTDDGKNTKLRNVLEGWRFNTTKYEEDIY